MVEPVESEHFEFYAPGSEEVTKISTIGTTTITSIIKNTLTVFQGLLCRKGFKILMS